MSSVKYFNRVNKKELIHFEINYILKTINYDD